MFQPQNKSTSTSLITANIVILILALVQSWSVPLILWTYWLQSVIIGIFQFFKILRLKDFSVEGVTMNGQPVKKTKGTKIQLAFFFAFHFGIFHFGYMMFLMGNEKPENFLYSMGISAAIFFANHLYSFKQHKEDTTKKPKNIGNIMFFPYFRIIPMHFIIVFGGMFIGGPVTLIFFTLLKTAADVLSHSFEHKI